MKKIKDMKQKITTSNIKKENPESKFLTIKILKFKDMKEVNTHL
jgi:hypothetical protein